MRPRVKAGGKAVKTQRHKTLKRRNAPKSARNRRSSAARPETEVARLTRELREAREQQAATSEVLGVISSSPGELGPVFEAILENATRICGGRLANLFLYSKHEHAFRLAAQRNAPAAYAERWAKNPVLRIGENPRNPLARLAKTKRVVAIPDLMVEPGYINREPRFVALVEAAGARTHVLIPMLKEGELVGGIAVYRQEVLPFTDRQIELLRNFAAQAVIAIENTRLLNELRQRTDDLSDSLEQQTATSEVLKVISSSPGKLQPVFEAMLENAVRICGAKFGTLFRYDGDIVHLAAQFGTPPALTEFQQKRGPFRSETARTGILGRVIRTKAVVHSADSAADPNPGVATTLGGARSIVGVPMFKNDALVGAIVIYRQEVRPFTDKQIDLVKNFAAQAVIAIENTRLLNELRESLQQQTATSEVLSVISSSPGELAPVFNSMLENATRICGAGFGTMFHFDGKVFDFAADYGTPPALVEFQKRRGPFLPPSGGVLARVLLTKQVAHSADYAAEQPQSPPVALGGARSTVAVPMLKDNELVGGIVIYRKEVRPFSAKEVDLVKNFAAQAVIAIENTRLLNELRESLQQQTATADVLKVISSSPGDLKPVFEAMLENAVRLCAAKFGSLVLFEGNAYRRVALHNAPAIFVETQAREPVRPLAASPTLSRLAETRQTICYADILAEQPEEAIARLGGARTVLAVPMLKDDRAVGAISIYRQEVRPFTDKQMEVLRNFAAQAVIAIENTRLLSELRESLQQQTATSDVLKAISSSLNDLEPVFETIGQRAEKLCDAEISVISMVDGDQIRLVSINGVTEEGVDAVRRVYPMRRDAETVTARTIRSAAMCHVPDVLADVLYQNKDVARVSGFRGSLGVPMIRDGQVFGAIFVARRQPGLFADNQVQLLKTFADQAVVAIENVRLFNETKEALDQQTATADVLKVISRSTFDLQVVLDTLAQSAVNLCDANQAVIRRRVGDSYPVAATCGFTQQQREHLERYSPKPGRGSVFGRAIVEGRTVHIPDVAADPEWERADQSRVSGIRAAVGVPLLREGVMVGILVVIRTEPRAFSQKQIELLETFADQAVIAIENVRLFDEVQRRTEDLTESLQQQTATSEVLGVISRSSGDLAPVFASILGNATRICEANFGGLFLSEGPGFRSVAQQGPLLDWWKQDPLLDVRRHPGLPLSRVARSKSVVHIADLAADVASHADDPRFVALVQTAGARTVLGVPMLKDDGLVGAIIIYRSDVRPFSDKQIELVQNFASQAIIAIENARLLNELRQSTTDLTQSLENLRTTQDRLVQTQKLASLGQLTAGIAHEIKNPLNFVNNFSVVSAELIEELQEALKDVSLNEKRRSEITELMETLRGNLDKIVQHGKRADAIVKNMLLHSREGSGEHRLVDINVLVEEGLNLAYHGARAEKQAFNITLEKFLDPAVGEADVFPQDITRVLLNLISNGFYAATKRKAQADNDAYEPTLAASTRNLGDHVEICIRDNGTGIPPDVKERIFNPFFTTKPAGEGTGLGLSISHDIVVKQHGGSIEVDTQPGEFTEFRIILPRRAATIAKPGDRA